MLNEESNPVRELDFLTSLGMTGPHFRNSSKKLFHIESKWLRSFRAALWLVRFFPIFLSVIFALVPKCQFNWDLSDGFFWRDLWRVRESRKKLWWAYRWTKPVPGKIFSQRNFEWLFRKNWTAFRKKKRFKKRINIPWVSFANIMAKICINLCRTIIFNFLFNPGVASSIHLYINPNFCWFSCI